MQFYIAPTSQGALYIAPVTLHEVGLLFVFIWHRQISDFPRITGRWANAGTGARSPRSTAGSCSRSSSCQLYQFRKVSQSGREDPILHEGVRKSAWETPTLPITQTPSDTSPKDQTPPETYDPAAHRHYWTTTCSIQTLGRLHEWAGTLLPPGTQTSKYPQTSRHQETSKQS